MAHHNIQAQQSIDLAVARSKASFPVADMSLQLYGSADVINRRRQIAALVAAEPAFARDRREGLSRVENVKLGLEMSLAVYRLKKEHNLTTAEVSNVMEALDDFLPMTLHQSAFIPIIYAQGTDEQAKYWGPLAENHQIIGCYAQTELGHGSNLSKLETIATLDRHSDSWIIHSTSFTAAKWWIGGLGCMATHGLIQARLIIDEKDYGAHGFIVPLRSLENHKCFPGVEAGDIGPKAYGGFSRIDNGFVRFNNYRIPRENMLMRFAKVTREGVYVKPPHDKLSYGSMVLLRSGMIIGASMTLAKAATISTRYLTVRRQFHNPTSMRDEANPKLETQVINYPMVQARILPIISQVFAMHAAGTRMWELYHSMLAELMEGNVDSLAEVHSISSGLKSTCSTMAATGAEDCRKLMGGHGYSAFSGISSMWANYVPSNTYEGDNFVLTQQSARYGIKMIRLAATEPKKLTSYSKFLVNTMDQNTFLGERCAVKEIGDWLKPEVQLAAFEHRSGRLTYEVAQIAIKGGKDVIWSDLNIECWRQCHAQSHYVLVRSSIEAVAKAEANKRAPSTIKTLKKLSDLFALHTIQANLADFLEDYYISPAQVNSLRLQIKQLQVELAPEAVGLMDAFDFSDFFLNSALGSSDGDAFKRLWDAAKAQPINQVEVVDGYEEFIRPILTMNGAAKL